MTPGTAPSRLVTRDLVAYLPVIISCLTAFAATRESLLGVDALAGRDRITLNSGTPDRAREFTRFAYWAAISNSSVPNRIWPRSTNPPSARPCSPRCSAYSKARR